MITNIRLQHFRSYSDASFEFSPAVNIIVGPNASGKTNLLEALLCISRGASYRAKDSDIVEYGAQWARLDAGTTTATRIYKLQLEGQTQSKKTFEINGKQLSRLSLASSVPVVLFEPNQLLLFIGSPELRRSYLDDILEQTVPGFAALRRQYRRALAQRNALLKNHYQQASNKLFAWNIRLSELGGQIADQRLKLIAEINERISGFYDSIAHDQSNIELQYITKCPPERYATSLLHQLETNVALDFERGFTTYGPHRDDILITIDGRDAKDVASRGETRTLLLVLKILEVQLLEAARDHTPLLLLDDVFSELDGARRRALTRFLQKYQTFITTTDADVVVQHFTESSNIIPLKREG